MGCRVQEQWWIHPESWDLAYPDDSNDIDPESQSPCFQQPDSPEIVVFSGRPFTELWLETLSI